MRLILITFLVSLFCFQSYAQSNCATAQPFCTGTTYNFPATTNASAQVGPYYDCLATQPNPAWYYLQISAAGNLTISIAGQQGGSSGQDVDFVCWGPFGSLNNICNSLTAGNVVDCSYSSSSTETCSIQNAIPGQFYMLCVTNYANVNQNIVFSQTAGNGATNCAILCNITGMTANPGACLVGANTYSVGGNLSVFAPPTTGNLTISNSCGGPPVVMAAPFSTLQPYVVPGLPANGNPCSLTASFSADPTCTFVVNFVAPPPCQPCNIVANNTGPYCENSLISLSSSNVAGAISYQWSGPGFNSSSQNPTIPSASAAMTGVYTVIATIASGTCSASTNVIVNPTPIVNIGNNSPICSGATLQLTSSGGTSYQWSGPNGFSSSTQNPSIPSSSLLNTGVYTVTVTSAAGCSAAASTNVNIGIPPVINASATTPVCVNDPIVFSATGGAIYSWSGPAGFGSAIANPTTTAFTASSGNYTVTVSDAIGCSSSAIVPVVVNQLPNPVISSNVSSGCAPLCVNFNLSSSTGVQSSFLQLGDGTAVTTTTASACYNASGIYTLSAEITDVNGCENSTTYTVGAYPVPVADFVFNPIRPIENDEVIFTNASHSGSIASSQWYFMNTPEYQSTSTNPSFVYTEAGTYVTALVVKTDMGCVDTILKAINVGEDFTIYVPNSFTPNDDGLNDVFQPKGYGVTKYELEVFDRWGEKIFHTNKFEEGWDGRFDNKGKLLAQGTYVWRIKLSNVFSEAKELTGHVTLMK